MRIVLRGWVTARREYRHQVVASVFLLLVVGGCSGLLEIDNPNNVSSDDIGRPGLAKYLVLGALGAVAAGYDNGIAVTSIASDELDSRGAEDAHGNLDRGGVSDPSNPPVNTAFIDMARGRWLADEAVAILEQHQVNRTLGDPLDLANAYLYSAMARIFIADMWDNFVFSNRDSAASPIGSRNMGALYDEAVTRLDKGLALAAGNVNARLLLTATKARAQFGRALWNLVGVRPIRSGIVNAADGAAAAATATAALALVTDPEWRFQFQYGATIGYSFLGDWTNGSRIARLGSAYVAPATGATFTWLDQVVLRDPVSNSPDPVVNAFQRALRNQVYFPLTVVSARELRLMVAEVALAGGDTARFQAQINAIRALNALPNWTPATGVSVQRSLSHERRVNLLLQGRRLTDQYRFGEPSEAWAMDAETRITPGVYLPIPMIECRANPHIGASNCRGLGG